MVEQSDSRIFRRLEEGYVKYWFEFKEEFK